ncbi:dihydroxy-acid dehydratase, partial [Elioraea sp.]|uniref:dihydroxy-acid dehydratase domain-containing protein n=1 Tax=Elioraea sp. TaxID=2185103 RepID=UPI0038D1E5B8
MCGAGSAMAALSRARRPAATSRVLRRVAAAPPVTLRHASSRRNRLGDTCGQARGAMLRAIPQDGTHGWRRAMSRILKVVLGPLSDPFKHQAGIAVLRGNLCPDGAVIKPSAATPALM